jgi:hypothetical protein
MVRRGKDALDRTCVLVQRRHTRYLFSHYGFSSIVSTWFCPCQGPQWNSLSDALLKKGTLVPSKTAVFVLQAPIQILTYGIAMYLIGYLTYVVYPISQAGYPAEPAKVG